jgi:hypothetical protein
MKIGSHCFCTYNDELTNDTKPVEVLGQMFLKETRKNDSADSYNSQNFSPECRKKMGILNLLRFGM